MSHNRSPYICVFSFLFVSLTNEMKPCCWILLLSPSLSQYHFFFLHLSFVFFSFLASILTRKGLEAADGFVYPAIEGRQSGVDAGQVGPAATDAETDDAHLEPLAIFFAHQRPASVSLLAVLAQCK